MTPDERHAIRMLVDARRRELVADDPVPRGSVELPASVRISHGTETAYVRGCRCDECRAAATVARRRRRERDVRVQMRRRLNAALGPCVPPVRRENHVRSVLRMLDQQARIQRTSTAGAGATSTVELPAPAKEE